MIKKNFLFRIKLFLLYFMPVFEGAIHIIISIVGQEHKKNQSLKVFLRKNAIFDSIWDSKLMRN